MLPDNKKIGKTIFQQRKKLDLTRKELGEKMGLHESTIQRYEEGKIKNISTKNLEKFAKSLNVKLDELLGGDAFEYLSLKTPFNEKAIEGLNPTTDPILHATKEEQLINTISFRLHDNSGVGLSNIKRGNKVDVLKSGEGVIATYDVELVLKAYELKPIKEKFSLEDIQNLADRYRIPDELKGITRKQYIKFMSESAMFFDDSNISDETKEKMLLSFQNIFYDAKERNKRKK
ncbi:helix-turn-helix domain-containing protein [Fusobacterium varium]